MRPAFTHLTLWIWPALIYLVFGSLVAAQARPSTDNRNGPLLTATLTRTLTRTPTRTPTCIPATPEPFQVEPVTSPTNLFTQTVTIRIGNGDAVTVTAESGVFTATGNFNAYGNPALVTMTLLANTTHHLEVYAHVSATPGGCYGNYTLHTTVDEFGAPLTIVQQANGGTPTPTPTSTLTPSITPTNTSTPTATPSPSAAFYLPIILRPSSIVADSVLLENGVCCVNARLVNLVDSDTAFTAFGSMSSVTEMRTANACLTDLSDHPWELFTPLKTPIYYAPLHWSTWRVAAQYRDALGDLSPIYCDEISVEGG